MEFACLKRIRADRAESIKNSIALQVKNHYTADSLRCLILADSFLWPSAFQKKSNHKLVPR